MIVYACRGCGVMHIVGCPVLGALHRQDRLDLFTAAAVTGLLSRPHRGVGSDEIRAQRARQIAEAVLAEQDKGDPQGVFSRLAEPMLTEQDRDAPQGVFSQPTTSDLEWSEIMEISATVRFALTQNVPDMIRIMSELAQALDAKLGFTRRA